MDIIFNVRIELLFFSVETILLVKMVYPLTFHFEVKITTTATN